MGSDDRPLPGHLAGPPLRRAADLGLQFLDGVADRPVGRPVAPDELRAALGGPLPETGEDPVAVVEALARNADPGLVATAGPRYFGFVVGGSLPAAAAAEWLATAWDQNAFGYVASPAGSMVEEVAGGWLLDVLGLPADAGIGFVTGATMANFTALAAARHGVLRAVGWDVEADGLIGAPAVNVVIGEEAHATIPVALRYVGLGAGRAIRVAADDQGRMRPEALRAALARLDGPTIVCAQAGNVNSGAFDPLDAIADATSERGAWLHVDGAFGLWAAASPDLRHHLRGVERAQSWATDCHKWLNVPYDSGLAVVADAAAHRAAMSYGASYLIRSREDVVHPFDWVADSSRHARGFAVYAALRSLGRTGLAGLVDRCCALARRFAAGLEAGGGRILNDVVLNQVLVRFEADGGEPEAGDARTQAIAAAVQRGGTCWAGTTTWHGRTAIRISVSNWSTTESDVDRSIEAFRRCAANPAGNPADR